MHYSNLINWFFVEKIKWNVWRILINNLSLNIFSHKFGRFNKAYEFITHSFDHIESELLFILQSHLVNNLKCVDVIH